MQLYRRLATSAQASLHLEMNIIHSKAEVLGQLVLLATGQQQMVRSATWKR